MEQFERTRNVITPASRSRTHARVTPHRRTGDSEQLSERLPEPPAGVLEATRLIKRVRIGPLFAAVNTNVAQPAFGVPLLDPQEQRARHATTAEAFRDG